MRRLVLVSLLLTGCVSTSPKVDPQSGLLMVYDSERHIRLGTVWVATTVDFGGYVLDEVIYHDGTRLEADAPQLSWASDYKPDSLWKDIPEFKASEYPVVLFGLNDRFVSARRARDGKIPETK